MAVNIFTYGSLMFSPVWDKVVSGNYLASSAALHGFSRKIINANSNPVACRTTSREFIKGIVYFDVDSKDLQKLDYFKGELFVREAITVELQENYYLPAEVYVVKSRFAPLVSDQGWNVDNFKRDCLSDFICSFDEV